MNRLVVIVSALVLTSLSLSGCMSTAPTGNKAIVMPAKKDGMRNAKSLAVVSVKANRRNRYQSYSENVLNKFESFLSNVSVGRENIFDLVDRNTIDAVLKEQKFSSQDTFDESTAADFGALVGADTLFTASFFVSDINNETYSDTQRYCKRYKTSAFGSSCEEYGTQTVRCQKRTARLEFTPKATAVSTGRIVYSETYKSAVSTQKCPNEEDRSLKSDDALISDALDSVFAKMRKDIADYELTLNIQLIDDDSEIPESVLPVYETAMTFADQNLWDRACTKFNELAASVSNSTAVLYNLGVCAEINGDPEAAKAYYERSLGLVTALSSGNQDLVFKAIRRMEGKEDLDEHNNEEKSWLDKLKESASL